MVPVFIVGELTIDSQVREGKNLRLFIMRFYCSSRTKTTFSIITSNFLIIFLE